MKTIFRLSLVLSMIIAGCDAPASGGWELVYRNDSDGKPMSGNKQALIDAVRLGLPVRIGFAHRSPRDTNRSVEHVVNAAFLTIANGREVFAQGYRITGQAPDLDGDTLRMRFRERNHWTVMVGSNGYFTSVMTDYLSDTLVNYNQDRQNAISWYVDYDAPKSASSPLPLWE